MENNAQMYIDLGEIIGAKKNFLLIRDKSREEIKKTKEKLHSAKNEYSDFGMYDDCGDAYRDWLEEAKIKHDIAIAFRVTIVVSYEKYFKKLRHSFLEKYPAFDWLLDEKIAQVINEHTKRKNGKT